MTLVIVFCTLTRNALAGAEPGSIIFQLTEELYLDGTSDVTAVGSPVVLQSDGTYFVVGPEALVDTDGITYEADQDLYQEAEDSPVIAVTTVRVSAATDMSDADLEEAWYQARPDGTVDEFQEWLSSRGDPGVPAPVLSFGMADWIATAADDATVNLLIVLSDQ
jgi:hypothetical protein